MSDPDSPRIRKSNVVIDGWEYLTTCGYCEGTGKQHLIETCETCEGTGFKQNESKEESEACDECEGRGFWKIEITCSRCDGDGMCWDLILDE